MKKRSFHFEYQFAFTFYSMPDIFRFFSTLSGLFLLLFYGFFYSFMLISYNFVFVCITKFSVCELLHSRKILKPLPHWHFNAINVNKYRYVSLYPLYSGLTSVYIHTHKYLCSCIMTAMIVKIWIGERKTSPKIACIYKFCHKNKRQPFCTTTTHDAKWDQPFNFGKNAENRNKC